MGGNRKTAVVRKNIVYQRRGEFFRFGMKHIGRIHLIKKPDGKVRLVQIQRIDLPAVPHRVVKHLAVSLYRVVDSGGALFYGLNKFKLLYGTLVKPLPHQDIGIRLTAFRVIRVHLEGAPVFI